MMNFIPQVIDQELKLKFECGMLASVLVTLQFVICITLSVQDYIEVANMNELAGNL